MTTWRDILPVHPAAEALPLLPPEALQELADDIKLNGLLEPPLLWHDVETDETFLLDGRNRLDAMELAGIDFIESKPLRWHLPKARAKKDDREEYLLEVIPITIESALDHPTVTLGKDASVSNRREYRDAAGLVIAANLLRRHLLASELASRALAIRATSPAGDLVILRQPVGVSLGGRGKTGEVSAIAKEIGVSVRTMERAVEKARRDASFPDYNSEAYKAQREKQAKAEATRQAKREAEDAAFRKAQEARATKEAARRKDVHKRLFDFCMEQVDTPHRFDILWWLTEAALDDRRMDRLEKAEDLMAGITSLDALLANDDPPTTCDPPCTDAPGHADWCPFAKAQP
jgi:ParB-like chromosome segregation protein Spo0J